MQQTRNCRVVPKTTFVGCLCNSIVARVRPQGLPIQCSVFLTRREGLLQSTNSSNADYLFQPDKLHADMVRPLVAPICLP